ncbi:MAG: methyltransferase domain-containing protein [Chloroflexi bacterium]|nr:methyltransferase domain-containing protein [Chloroflexota bacterium]
MAHTDRARWDERYADPISALQKGPHKLLTHHAPAPYPGIRALELACGLGRNALWLAERGYTVDAFDISLEALRRARDEMQRRELAGVNFVVADLDCFPLPDVAYDLVYVFRFLDRRLFPAIRSRVCAGGLVIYQTLNVNFLAEHPNAQPEHMLGLGELPRHFPGWDVIEARDGQRMSSFVGRKPASK